MLISNKMFYSGHCVKYSENHVVVIEEDMTYRLKQIHAFEWNEIESTRIPCPKSKLPTQCVCWTSSFLLLWIPSNWQSCSTIWSWALRNPWAFFESSYLELHSSVCWKLSAPVSWVHSYRLRGAPGQCLLETEGNVATPSTEHTSPDCCWSSL